MPSDCAQKFFEKIIRRYFILDEDAFNPIDTDSGYCEATECKIDLGSIKKGCKVDRLCFDGDYFYIWLNSPAEYLYRIKEADIKIAVDVEINLLEC